MTKTIFSKGINRQFYAVSFECPHCDTVFEASGIKSENYKVVYSQMGRFKRFLLLPVVSCPYCGCPSFNFLKAWELDKKGVIERGKIDYFNFNSPEKSEKFYKKYKDDFIGLGPVDKSKFIICWSAINYICYCKAKEKTRERI